MGRPVVYPDVLRPNTRLVHAREAAGLTQEALSMQAGVSRAIIGMAERLGYKPGADLQARLAAALQCSVADLWPDVSAPVEVP